MAVRPICPTLAAIAGLFAALVGAMPALAQGTEEERRACTPDVMRLCREYIPSVDRIVACMEARHAELSPACQMVMRPPAPPAAVAAAPAKPAIRRTATRASGGKAAAKPRSTKPVPNRTPAATAKSSTRPLNLLPTAKPAPAKKVTPRNKQAQRAP